MRTSKEDKPDNVATLTMIISYDRVPSDDDMQELLDKAREVGGVDSAILKIHAPMTRDLTTEF